MSIGRPGSDRHQDLRSFPHRRLVRGWRLAALLLLGVCLPAWPQSRPDSERTVELVLARSERAARVVERVMRSGFFVDQLRIPETSYLGRVPWAEANPNVREALDSGRPGVPIVFDGRSGQLLVARVMPTEPAAVLGQTGFVEEREKTWARLSMGLTDPGLLAFEIDVDNEDLRGVCESKERLNNELLRRAKAKVAALPQSVPMPELAGAYAALIGMHALKGEIAEAIQAVEAVASRASSGAPTGTGSPRDIFDRFLGILELRRGEVENCLHHHNQEMCLFPLSEEARHRLDDGAQRAAGYFARYLERNPDDLEVRWLLNVTAMTLANYPEGVPEHLRIGPEAFESEVDLGRFWDVAGPAGVSHSDCAGGSVTDDFDGDGLLDIVVSSRDPCEPLRLYLSSGDGTFEDATESAGLRDQLGGLNVTQVDFDNDGRLDLYVMRGGWETSIRDSLLRNLPAEGGGVRFEDVTARAGLGGPGHRTHSAGWADYDGDGWLDLFVGHEMSFSRLLRNRGNGTFEDTTVKAGLRFRSLTKGATWGDVNNDGWPDLYVSNFGDRNLLFVNRGDGRFDEVARERGVSGPLHSFPTLFWDYDNDGWQDLLVVSFLSSVDEIAREYLGMPPLGETLRVYRNRGDGSFEDTTEAVDMVRMIPSMGANFGDLDNDGYPDIYLGTGAPPYGMLVPNRMLVNLEGKRFVDVTTSTGTGHLQKGHGISFADLDNDGDQDIFANIGGAFPGDKYPSALFENPGHGNDWIALELVGTRSSRAALGARIRVVLRNEGSDEQQERFRWVGSGGSFGSSPFMQHVGLGKGATIVEVEIDWPARRDGERTRQILRDVPVNSWIVVTEGAAGFELRPRPKFALGSDGAEGHSAHGGH